MDDILGKHKQDFNEIRRLCFLCHGLDKTSSEVFSGSTYSSPSKASKSVLHSLLSSHLLQLAIAIRVNLYQGLIENELIPMESMAVGYYEDDESIVRSVTVKDVCDKIIHADVVSKPIYPQGSIDDDTKICIQLKGVNRKKAWTFDLSLELFVEKVLTLLDEIECGNE